MQVAPLKARYDSWYEVNREALLKNVWNLVNPELLMHPQMDTLRGLNLLGFVPSVVSSHLDACLLSRLSQVLPDTYWLVPPSDRHITILDLIPHNAGLAEMHIQELVPHYTSIIRDAIREVSSPLALNLRGIFASPDGITIQGYPQTDSLEQIRVKIRRKAEERGLPYLETHKYPLATAHIAFIKFTHPLDGRKLVECIDKLRSLNLGTTCIDQVTLTLSGRYDKSKTACLLGSFPLNEFKAGKLP